MLRKWRLHKRLEAFYRERKRADLYTYHGIEPACSFERRLFHPEQLIFTDLNTQKEYILTLVEPDGSNTVNYMCYDASDIIAVTVKRGITSISSVGVCDLEFVVTRPPPPPPPVSQAQTLTTRQSERKRVDSRSLYAPLYA